MKTKNHLVVIILLNLIENLVMHNIYDHLFLNNGIIY